MDPTLIVITGAASGIGLQLARHFQNQNLPMVLIDVSEDLLGNHFSTCSHCYPIAGDVSKEKTWQNIIEKAKEIRLPISHLVNCAGVIRPGFLVDYAISDIDYHLDINTKGTILGTTIIGREMKFQEFGHIINVSSLAGLAPVSGLSLYVASKFAVRGFSLAVAAELRDFGVDVSVICPDLVNTPMLDLQLNYPEEAKLTFSGPSKVLQSEDIVREILNLMRKPKLQVTVPASRGLLAKIAGAWPAFAEIFRNSLEKKGRENMKKLRK
ncbi:SDR family oxidoreductase [Algoriphagus sp. AK58]|uniref:SDR family NAD(P)-dependent oxidoreductase n=1 Tax=Algoriphagus sp. AK58 TaxID=1406877 RepID=UPI00164F1F0B|nr:SDR family oxidoreductase [Algoriphagus sp. AK58]